MTAVMTATARGTPGPGPSQATAPVLEFRCLWTRDTHKKQKKWHDGSLRYHTFNRRVMVYDDTNYYIGDVHYRGEDEVGEGTELTLDRHVLVEVGEPVGQTETDLNQVVHQRASPDKQTTQRLHSTVRIPAATQGKPKSIKEVLGASQGHLGRARLPSQSPFDQRQMQHLSHPAEPPPKRTKVAPGKENLPQPEPPRRLASPQITRPRLQQEQQPSSSKPSRPHLPAGSTQELVGRVEEVYNLSSDEEPAQSSRARNPKRQRDIGPQRAKPSVGDAGERGHTRLPSLMPTSAPAKKPVSEQRRPHQPQNKAVEQSQAVIARLSPPLQSTHSLPSSNVYTPKPGTTQLQLSRTKPRRKLMYRALLPSSALQSSATGTVRDPPNTKQPIVSSVFFEQSDPDDEDVVQTDKPARRRSPGNDHRDSQPLTAKNPTGLPAQEPSNELGLANTPIDISSSPLFVPHDDSYPPPQTAERHIESSQEFETRMLQGRLSPGQSLGDPIDLSPKESPNPILFPAAVNISPLKLSRDRSPSPVSSRSPSPVLIQAPPPQVTQERVPPPPIPVHGLTKASGPIAANNSTPIISRQRAFRRTLSANDAEEPSVIDDSISDDEFGGPNALLSEFPPTAALLRPNRTPRRPSPTKSRVPAQLRRTLSDPVAVDSVLATTRTVSLKGVNVEEPIPEPGEEATGPWTVAEAWLLFEPDSWPSSKKDLLPAWAATSTSTSSTVVARAGGTLSSVMAAGGGFGSARGLLERERERTAQGTGVLRDEAGVY